MTVAQSAVTILATTLHVVLVGAALVLLPGAAAQAGGVTFGMPRPSLLAPWREWRRLMRKNTLRLAGQSPLVPASAVMAAVSLVLALGLLPSGSLLLPSLRLSDLLLVLMLPLLARLAQAVALLEAGVAHHASPVRTAMMLVVCSLPAMLLVTLVLATAGGTTGTRLLVGALPGLAGHHAALPTALALATLALAVLAAADLAQDVGIADVVTPGSGCEQALWRLCAAARLLVWSMLIAMLVPPWATGWQGSAGRTMLGVVLGSGIWLVKLLLVAFALQAGGRATARSLAPARAGALAGLAGLVAVLALLLGDTLSEIPS